MGLSILSRGTMDEKLRWIFNLYDLNRDGKVTKEELLLVITSIYELMGKCTTPQIDDNSPKQHVEVVFKVNIAFLPDESLNLKILLTFFYYFRN